MEPVSPLGRTHLHCSQLQRLGQEGSSACFHPSRQQLQRALQLQQRQLMWTMYFQEILPGRPHPRSCTSPWYQPSSLLSSLVSMTLKLVAVLVLLGRRLKALVRHAGQHGSEGQRSPCQLLCGSLAGVSECSVSLQRNVIHVNMYPYFSKKNKKIKKIKRPPTAQARRASHSAGQRFVTTKPGHQHQPVMQATIYITPHLLLFVESHNNPHQQGRPSPRSFVYASAALTSLAVRKTSPTRAAGHAESPSHNTQSSEQPGSTGKHSSAKYEFAIKHRWV